MNPILLAILSRSAPLSWAAAVAGVWLLPRLVIVLTGLAVAGTLAGAVKATDDEMKARLVRLLADATRPAPAQQEDRQARLGCLRVAR